MIYRAQRLPRGEDIYLQSRVRDYQVAKIAIPGSYNSIPQITGAWRTCCGEFQVARSLTVARGTT